MGQEFVGDVRPRGKGTSIAALILGIISILCCCIGFPFAIVGIICAIIALVKNKGAKPAAVTGLILSILCMIMSIVSVTKIIPYKNDIVDFSKNIDEYVEKYDKSGEIPPLFEKIQKDGNISDEDINNMMDKLSKSYKEGKGQTENSSDIKSSSKTKAD